MNATFPQPPNRKRTAPGTIVAGWLLTWAVVLIVVGQA